MQGGGPELPAGVPKVMGRQGKEGQTVSYKEIGRDLDSGERKEEKRKRRSKWGMEKGKEKRQRTGF